MKKNYLKLIVAIVFASNLFAQNIPSYVPKDGLVGWWPFNGNANDESGNGNHGVGTNISFGKDKSLIDNKSLVLNGKGYVTISNSTVLQGLNNELSICGWFKPTSFFNNQWYSIICKSNNFSPMQFNIQAFPTGINFLNNGVAYQFLKNLSVDNWYFFAIVQKDKSVTFFINDSKFIQSVPGSYNYNYSNNNNIEIGRDIYGSTEYSSGSTDDISVYNRALTDQEVNSLYTGTPLCNMPNATITPQGNTNFCQGGFVNLNASTGANYTYEWYNNGQLINGATSSVYQATTSGNYTVKVIDGACNATSTATTVSVNQYPSSDVSVSGPTTFCEGGSVTLTALGNGTFKWNNGVTSKSIIINKSGIYRVEVTSNNCTSSSKDYSIAVNPNPIAKITPDGPTAFCEGGAVNLVASGGTTYKWNSGILTPSITPLACN